MNIMPSSLLCKAARPSGATSMLNFVWLETARPLDALLAKNYNQTLKELKSHFSERRAMALVCKLEKYMMQLVQIMQKVTELTDEYRQKNLEK